VLTKIFYNLKKALEIDEKELSEKILKINPIKETLHQIQSKH